MSRLNGFQNYKPKERNIKAVKYIDEKSLSEALGSAFVKEDVKPSDHTDVSVFVYNVKTHHWQHIMPGDYVTIGDGGEYVVVRQQTFDEKYEHYVTRDQGFQPSIHPSVIGGTVRTPAVGVNRGTHVDSPKVGGLSGGSCRG